MKKGLIPGLTFVAALALAAAPAFAAEVEGARPEAVIDTAAPATAVEGAPTDAPTVIFLTRDEQEKAIARRALARPASSALMTFHGGSILTTSSTHAIFWGANWSNSSFVGDKISGLSDFYNGFGGSNYAGTSTEYTGTNGQVTRISNYSGYTIDGSAGPTRAPKTSTILAEVCNEIASPVANGYYPVYTDLPRGHAGYCAWHSWGTCNGVSIQFAFFFDLDGDPGCDPGDTTTGHSQGLAALANVSAHELSEAMTDPLGAGWFDSSGAENGDKCAWTFNVPSVSFSNGTSWMLQGEWSNNAYNTPGAGYPNRSGQNGCLDGH
jgi:hypothetical protein